MKVCDGNIFPDNDNFKKVVKMIYADIKAGIKQQCKFGLENYIKLQ